MREKIDEVLTFFSGCTLTIIAREKIASRLEPLINQEVEKRIAERMPTMEETIDMANEYVSHKSLHKANKGLIRDAVIIGVNMFRSRLTTPETESSQKTKGGGE